MGDKDFKSGILLKVKRKKVSPGCSKQQEADFKYDYEVVGISVININFNRNFIVFTHFDYT